RIELGVLLVAGDDARSAVHARGLLARLPVRRVGAEEEDGEPDVARSLHRDALAAGPIFVVADGQERAAREQSTSALAADVEVRGVADVVAVALEEARHQRLVPE